MPGFFSSLQAPKFSSSAAHRHAQRVLAGSELIASSIKDLSEANTITGKVTQVIISIYSILRKDTHQSEKLLHAMQGLIALAQACFAITLYMEDETCKTNNESLCKLMYVLDKTYIAVLAAGWLPSEVSKDHQQGAGAQASAPRAGMNEQSDDSYSVGLP